MGAATNVVLLVFNSWLVEDGRDGSEDAGWDSEVAIRLKSAGICSFIERPIPMNGSGLALGPTKPVPELQD